jgi:hypothetical protein
MRATSYNLSLGGFPTNTPETRHPFVLRGL